MRSGLLQEQIEDPMWRWRNADGGMDGATALFEFFFAFGRGEGATNGEYEILGQIS